MSLIFKLGRQLFELAAALTAPDLRFSFGFNVWLLLPPLLWHLLLCHSSRYATENLGQYAREGRAGEVWGKWFYLGGGGGGGGLLFSGFGFLAGNLRLLLQQCCTSFTATQLGLPI